MTVRTTKERPAIKEFVEEIERWNDAHCAEVGGSKHWSCVRFLEQAVPFLRIVDDQVIGLVIDCWYEEEIIPIFDINELREWCGAGMAVRPYLRNRLGMTIDPVCEPALPLPPK
jgi:hypothetical protein